MQQSNVANFDPQIHESEPGKILDTHGKIIEVRKGFMAQADEKGSEKVTLSKSMLGFLGTVLVIAVYVVTVSMNYQGTLSRVGEIDERVKKLETAVMEMQKLQLNVNTIQSDVSSIKQTQQNNEQDRKEVMKNINDIQILLAKRAMTQE